MQYTKLLYQEKVMLINIWKRKNMNIQKIVALIILFSGLILLVYGFIENNQVSLFTGIALILITILDYTKLKNRKK